MATVATTEGSSHGSREARRRRIIERGSDRLALITGRIQSLPPDPDQSRSSTFRPIETPAAGITDSGWHENAVHNSLPNQESSSEPGLRHTSDYTKEPLPQNTGICGSIMSRSVALNDTREERSQISSTTQAQAPAWHGQHQREQGHRNSLTTGQISSAISASENIRLCCSVVAAILVILSYIGFPIPGFRAIRGATLFRPVYLLLLMNVSIVLGRVILGMQGSELRTDQRSNHRIIGGNSSVDKLGKALGAGLMLQNIVRAMFMDFSIYVVVLVCGLAFLGGFGW